MGTDQFDQFSKLDWRKQPIQETIRTNPKTFVIVLVIFRGSFFSSLTSR